jgi:hypothetical protein
MFPKVRKAERLGIGDQEAEYPVTLWQVADCPVRLCVEAGGDELGQARLGVVEDADGAVPGVHEIHGRVDDALQDRRQLEVGAQGDDCVDELAKRSGAGELRHSRILG